APTCSTWSTPRLGLRLFSRAAVFLKGWSIWKWRFVFVPPSRPTFSGSTSTFLSRLACCLTFVAALSRLASNVDEPYGSKRFRSSMWCIVLWLLCNFFLFLIWSCI
ncbi:hypothetical protein LINGRAHAP2_LOCUS3507, partial [Linum grandiflorum]